MYVHVLWNTSNCTDNLTKILREIRGTICAFYSSIQHTALKWLSGTRYDGNNFFFQYGVISLFIFVISFLNFSCTLTPRYISILLHASFLSNKTLESCDIWVNSRVLSTCATNSPGHNADKLNANNQRAARITLASVFTFTRHTSTDQVVSYSIVFDISAIACCTGYDDCFDCLELWRMGSATWRENSPATECRRTPAAASEWVSEISGL